MPFPEVKRVIYKKNPLDQVVCQLRFPPILKIDADIPAEFQDRLRGDFPNYAETSEWKVELSPKIKGQIPAELLTQMLQSSSGKNYEFASEDGLWKINLTRTFIALTANEYERWEKFKEKLAIPFNALADIYSPAYFSRVGLRYVDVIKRSVLNLDGVSWTELLQPYILGVLSAPDLDNLVHHFENRYEIGLSDRESIVRMITRFVEDEKNGEICYMIDND
ncbi:TIGR04255 family protein, partial [bacterium]|nr:TIGR04255 family protein [bacterium]